jgi:DNA primase
MPGIDYQRLRRQIKMRAVLARLGFQPASRHGLQLRGVCPIPGCRSRGSFSVHLGQQIYHCFACHSRGNALDLWAAANGLPLYQAALSLSRVFRFDPPLCQPPAVPFAAPQRNR